MFCLVLLLAAADPSPTLQAIVALGREAQTRATLDALTPATPTPTLSPPLPIPSKLPAHEPTPAPVLKTAGSESGPWAGGGALLALSGGAFALWWRKRGVTSTNVLEITQSVAIGRGRSLLVAEISGRRVLLSSSEGGVSLLLDLGTAPVPASFEATLDDLLPSMAGAPTANVDIEGKEIQRRLAHARSST